MTPRTLSEATASQTVWRIGFRPDPWAWSGWEWATNGRFPGRWDDVDGTFRTIYAGSSLLACLLEVLAGFRRDPRLAQALDDIVEDEADRDLHPTLSPGLVPREWLDPREVASGTLRGQFCAVTASASVAALYPHFIGLALTLGLTDFDAAALKDARPRRLTQSVATWLYETTDFDGVTFTSRHGDDLTLWAVFERPGDPQVSPRVIGTTHRSFEGDEPELMKAFRLLGLQWRND
ncbi:hypothetical protein IWX75_003475 [Arthrobacter sp. CAN_A6]|uniref:RES domain-containing protein n=1 Tax=unclassified Arthrobacter TaxID=235627 RepID=UPI0004B292ED|nr:RES domain-containing protein [Arthrobacter sp. H5]